MCQKILRHLKIVIYGELWFSVLVTQLFFQNIAQTSEHCNEITVFTWNDIGAGRPGVCGEVGGYAGSSLH